MDDSEPGGVREDSATGSLSGLQSPATRPRTRMDTALNVSEVPENPTRSAPLVANTTVPPRDMSEAERGAAFLTARTLTECQDSVRNAKVVATMASGASSSDAALKHRITRRAVKAIWGSHNLGLVEVRVDIGTMEAAKEATAKVHQEQAAEARAADLEERRRAAMAARAAAPPGTKEARRAIREARYAARRGAVADHPPPPDAPPFDR